MPFMEKQTAHGILLALLIVLCLLPEQLQAQSTTEPPRFKGAASIDVHLMPGEQASRSLTLLNPSAEPLEIAFLGLASTPFLENPPVDDVGYTWTDSRQRGAPAFAWHDIRTLGRHLPNDPRQPVTLPFPFPFYGNVQTFVNVSPSGYLTFGPDAHNDQNRRIPNRLSPNDIIAPFWDNLTPEPEGSIHTYHDADENRFIVQYTNMRHLSDPSSRSTFQVMLYPSGNITFHYLEMGPTDDATIGLENDLGTDGLLLAHLDNLVADNLAISLNAPSTFVHVDPLSATIAPGQHLDLQFVIDASGLPQGPHAQTLLLATSDASRSLLPIPINLIVEDAPPSPLRMHPPELSVHLEQGSSTQRIITIENTDVGQAYPFNLAIRSTHGEPDKSLPNGSSSQVGPLGGPGRSFQQTALTSNLFGSSLSKQAKLLRFDLNEPTTHEQIATSPIIAAGDFPLGNPDLLYVITADNLFQSVDPVTGLRTNIGMAIPDDPQEIWTELAVDPTDGLLYAATTNNNRFQSFLYHINPEDGQAIRIGELEDSPLIAAIALDDTGQMYGLEILHDNLIRIDKRTGATDLVGPTGFSANNAQGMDFDLTSGTLYLAAFNSRENRAELRTASRTSGQTTLIASYDSDLTFGFLALPSGDFISPSDVSGVVQPGERLDLDVTFDAERLLAGTYSATITLAGTAGSPPLSILAELNVLGNASLEIPRGFLEFGSVFVHDTVFRPLTLTNRGSDTLLVTQASSDEAAFSLSSASLQRLPLALPPGGTQRLIVNFAPTTVGELSGTLVLESNDPLRPTTSITLGGRGIAAPELSLDQAALEIQAVVGQIQSRTLTLQNTGGNTLTYQIAKDEAAFSDAILPPLLIEDFSEGIPASWRVFDHLRSGIAWLPHTQFPGNLFYSNWTGGQGAAAMVSSDAFPHVPYDTELRTPLLHAETGNLTLYFRANYADKGPDVPDYFDVDLSTDGGTTWITLQRWNEDLGTIFEGPGSAVALDLSPHLSTGDDFRIRWRYHTTEGRPDNWYVQIDDVHIGVVTDVLTLTPDDGQIPSAASQDIGLSFNAVGLQAGTYESSLSITTNDPLAPETNLPILLTVIEGVQASSGTFTAYPNQQITLPIHLIGNVDLEPFTFTLTFDPSLLTVLDVITDGTLTESLPLTLDASAPGEATISYALPPPDQRALIGEKPLLFLDFLAHEKLGETDLVFSHFRLNGNNQQVTTLPGHLALVPLYGDATLDLRIDQMDLSAISQHVLRGATLNTVARQAADVSGDGTVTLGDASYIRQFIDGQIPCFPAEPTCSHADKQPAAGTGQLTWGTLEPNANSQTTRLPLVLQDQQDPITSVFLSASLSSGTIERITPPPLPDGWTFQHRLTEDRLAIALWGTTPLPEGVIAALQLSSKTAALPSFYDVEARLNDAVVSLLDQAEHVELPHTFTLHGNYPNPFNPTTTIQFDLPERAQVQVEVYDLLGRRVLTTPLQELAAGASRTITVQAQTLASGSYFYRVVARGEKEIYLGSGRMTLLK